MKVGLLLPHFGRHATSSRLVDRVARIDALGYDSVWVRDHLVYRPHSFEDQDATFIEAFTALAAAAACTSRLILGTATLIPFRHPIHSALHLSSLTTYVPAERLIIGWGRGYDASEFAAIGGPWRQRGALLEEHVDVIRKLATGEPVTHHGRYYSFENVRIHAPDGPIRFWYGGGTPRAMERTVNHFEGLLASRMPASILSDRIELLNSLARDAGRRTPSIGLVTLVSPGRTLEDALTPLDVDRIGGEIERRFPGRSWDVRTGFDGVVIAGPPDHMAEQLSRFEAIGVEHFVIDLRARFEEWESFIEEIADTLLPLVQRTPRRET